MKSTFFTILVLVLIGSISGVYFYRSQFQKAAEYSAAPTNSALELINRLEQIKIDRTFFENPDYKALQVYPQESLDGIDNGRSNPYVGKIHPLFAPDLTPKNTTHPPRTGTQVKPTTGIQPEPFVQ